VITHDTVPKLARFAASANIGYTLLSDADAKIIPAFGIANEKFAPGTAWYGVAHPLTVVVDPKGVIRHRFSGGNYADRPEVDFVLGVLREEAGQ
jgi:peroxiredoxin